MNSTIEITGRTLTVTPINAKWTPYMLTGPKGATFGVVRFLNRPERMRVASFKGYEPFPGVVLTDVDGTLRVVA